MLGVGAQADAAGGVLGAAVFLLLEEVLSAWTGYWAFWVGWVLIAAVLFAPRGVTGLFRRKGVRA